MVYVQGRAEDSTIVDDVLAFSQRIPLAADGGRAFLNVSLGRRNGPRGREESVQPNEEGYGE